MNETLKAALEYASRGWHVIPVRKNRKEAAVPWAKYREQPPTSEELEQWFANGDANIAILTGKGSSLYVIDVDDQSLIEEWLQRHPTAMVSRTPGKKGAHLFYSVGNGKSIPNTTGKLHKGVDTRGDGGYVVVPPSTIDGHPYQWESLSDPSPLPPEVLTLVYTPPTNTENSSPTNEALDGLVSVLRKGFAPGHHNVQMKNIARFLFRAGMQEGPIHALLASLDRLDPTPLGNKERVSTIRSGIGYEKTRLARKESTQEKEHPFGIQSMTEAFAAFGEQNMRWLIDGWLAEDSIIAMVADPGSYKTWLALEAAITVALGEKATSFLAESRNLKPARPVLVVQQEDYPGRVMERVQAILYCKGKYVDREVTDEGGTFSFDHPWDVPVYFHNEANLHFENIPAMDAMEQVIKEKKIKLVVLDPLYMLEKVDDNYLAGAAAGGIAVLKRLRNDYGVTFLLVHHTRKSGGPGRLKVWGSQLLNAAFEGVWLIEKSEDGNTLNITREGKTFPDTRKFTMSPVIKNVESRRNSVNNKPVYEMIASDVSTGVEMWMNKYSQSIAELLKDSPVGLRRIDIATKLGVSASSLDASLTELYDAKKVSKVNGRYEWGSRE